jgi:hypothetical protein
VTIFKPRTGDSVSSIACVGDFAIDDDDDQKQTDAKASENGKKPKNKK